MGFKYHGNDPVLVAVDNALIYYQQEATGRAVTAIQRNKMASLVNMIGALIASPKALDPAPKAKTNELLDDLMQISPTGARPGMERIHNRDDIRPRKPYGVLTLVGLQYHMKDPVTEALTLANGHYVFAVVTSRPWEVRTGERVDGGHTAITRGASVYFAGEMTFDQGGMQRWNNDSGHYHPLSALHGQVVQLLPQNRYVQAV